MHMVKIAILRDVTPCYVVEVWNISKELAALIMWYISMVLHPRSLYSHDCENLRSHKHMVEQRK